MQIDSFEKFERSSKRQRDSGGAEHGEGDGQHKHKHHRQHHRDSHHHEGKQSKHEGGGHQEAAADAAPDGKLRATKQLSDFVKVRREEGAWFVTAMQRHRTCGDVQGCRSGRVAQHVTIA